MGTPLRGCEARNFNFPVITSYATPSTVQRLVGETAGTAAPNDH
jgi:hypothetical protein